MFKTRHSLKSILKTLYCNRVVSASKNLLLSSSFSSTTETNKHAHASQISSKSCNREINEVKLKHDTEQSWNHDNATVTYVRIYIFIKRLRALLSTSAEPLLHAAPNYRHSATRANLLHGTHPPSQQSPQGPLNPNQSWYFPWWKNVL